MAASADLLLIPSALPTRRTKVLVAEDNPDMTLLIQAYVTQQRLIDMVLLDLDFAVNGVEAVQMRQQKNYDLVLMDIEMPVMDGYTATKEIRAWERATGAPRIPILALTAHELQGGTESLEAGCDGHLSKPIEREHLIAVISKFTERPQDAREELISEMIAARRPAYLANRRLDASKLWTAFYKQDFPACQTIGHKCKGTGNGYGFPEITRLGAAIEQAARALDAIALKDAISCYEACLDKA